MDGHKPLGQSIADVFAEYGAGCEIKRVDKDKNVPCGTQAETLNDF